MKLISIIVPCLNEQEVIPIFYRTVTEVLDSLENAEYELQMPSGLDYYRN